MAWNDVQREMEQGFQGWEYKFNSVSSSRGDYPFITMTAGTGTSRFAKMATITMLNVREKKATRSRYCSRSLYFYMMRISTDRGRSWRTSSRRESSVPQRRCIRTGCH